MGGNLDHHHSEMSEWGETERAERPKKKRREKATPLEVELDLGGESHRGNMSISSVEMEKNRI